MFEYKYSILVGECSVAFSHVEGNMCVPLLPIRLKTKTTSWGRTSGRVVLSGCCNRAVWNFSAHRNGIASTGQSYLYVTFL